MTKFVHFAEQSADMGFAAAAVTDAARPEQRRPLRRGPRQHTLRADDFCNHFRIAQSVLQRQHPPARSQQRRRIGRRRLCCGRLDKQNHQVDRFHPAGSQRRVQPHDLVACRLAQRQSLTANRRDMLRPDIHHRHRCAGFRQISAEQAAHRACANHGNLHLHSPLSPINTVFSALRPSS